MANEPDLYPGQQGEWVQYLQEQLNNHYQTLVVTVTGEYDPLTTQTVQYLRQQNALPTADQTDGDVWKILTGTRSQQWEEVIDAATSEHEPGVTSSWSQSDWAGRAILARWLSGEGDWFIAHDPAWTEYMEANDLLRVQLMPHVLDVVFKTAALGAADSVHLVNEHFPVSIDNGECIVGYQYLHGTNAKVGHFQIVGSGQLLAPEHGGRHKRVQYQLTYHWNDLIDPNAQYATDIFKSMFGQVISAGQAADYRIEIIWSSEALVTVDEDGAILDISDVADDGRPMDGYPLR